MRSSRRQEAHFKSRSWVGVGPVAQVSKPAVSPISKSARVEIPDAPNSQTVLGFGNLLFVPLRFSPGRAYALIMKAIQIEYPEAWTAAAGSSSERFENEARLALGMKLFEMGRLTSG